MHVTPTAFRADAAMRVAVVQASLVGGSVLAGLLGTHATKSSMVSASDGSSHLFWTGAVPTLGRVAALEAIGAMPLAAPFAVVTAFLDPATLSRHVFSVWVCANLTALGVSPAAGALGDTLLHGHTHRGSLATASLVGQIALFAVQCGAALLAGGTLAALSLSATTRGVVPACLTPLMHRSAAFFGVGGPPRAAARPPAAGSSRRTPQRWVMPCPPYNHQLERLPEYSSRRPSLAESGLGALARR